MNGRKKKALQALLIAPTRTEAAKMAGIGTSTLRTYLKDEEFRREYESALREVVADATAEAEKCLHPALVALRSIIEDEEAATSSRIAASRTILESALKFVELMDVSKRLDKLEEIAQQTEGRR